MYLPTRVCSAVTIRGESDSARQQFTETGVAPPKCILHCLRRAQLDRRTDEHSSSNVDVWLHSFHVQRSDRPVPRYGKPRRRRSCNEHIYSHRRQKYGHIKGRKISHTVSVLVSYETVCGRECAQPFGVWYVFMSGALPPDNARTVDCTVDIDNKSRLWYN